MGRATFRHIAPLRVDADHDSVSAMKLCDFEPLNSAETRLVAECHTGERITVGDGELPDECSAEVEVRAGIIRIILSCSDEEICLHDKGLRLRGAWISGRLDLQGARCQHDISLTACHVVEPIEMVNSRLRGLFLSGCVLAGLSADNAHLNGALFLRSGSVVNGEISLAGARISGDLQICDATLISTAQDAVFAPSLNVEGSVFLGNYPYSNGVTSLVSQGAIFLTSLSVDHDLFVTNCAISLQPEIIGEQVFQGAEEHGANMILSLARSRIGGILYFKDNQIARGVVSLAGVSAVRFRDEPTGPGASYLLRLDGFTYEDFSRHAETGLHERLLWLERRPDDTPFTAQPYEQLARVLMHLGHRADARTVLMRKERLLRGENRKMMRNRAKKSAAFVVDSVMRFAVGYGYRPGRVLGLAILLILGLGMFFQKTWDAGDMAPNAAPILVSSGWISATQTHADNPAKFWSAKGNPGQDWETFQSFAYAADLVVPIVNLGQEAAWAPSTSRNEWGQMGWWIRWFAKAAGWIITALGAAAVTGAVRQD